MRLKIWITLVSVLISTLLATQTSQAADILEPCKIQSTDTISHMRVGWPVDKNTLSSTGVVKVLVLIVDFSDDPQGALQIEALKQKMELQTVGNYYSSVSNGLFKPIFTVFPQYVRMPETSAHYGQQLEVDEIVNGEWESHHMTHDAIHAVANKVKISDFQAAIVVVSGGSSLSGHVALATSQDPGIDIHTTGEIHNSILVGIQAFSTEGIRPWMIMVHEINHLMGVADLYLYATDGWWQGKSVGPFGMQGYLRGNNSTDSLGWNRWLRGWVPESRILCIENPINLSNIKMSPSGSNDSNYEMIILRKSQTVVYVIEAVKNIGFDASTYKNSLLIYKIDSSIAAGKGPISIIPKKTKTTFAPLSPALPDWVRFQEAPIRPLEQTFYDGLLFRNVNYKSGAILFSLFTGAIALEQEKVQPKTILCRVEKKLVKISAYNPKCGN